MPVKKVPMINEEINTLETNLTETLGEENQSMSLTQENMLSLIELFFFAYRDFTEEGDEILDTFGFGRAHHRVIHFVHHYPGLRVADLLGILKITKQSLARVLKQLIEQDFICQKEGSKDRRERLLYTTDKGNKLAKELAEPQINRFEATMSQFSKSEQKLFENFLFKLIRQSNRQDVISLMAQNGHFPDGKPD
jgi:DNA-binding MarR family transcriptional regulator